ncbi:tetratricopeptide repeat-containing hybrid sensor histidine kinase/response regulator [Aquimarina sp. 2201CG14-23]|uniref:tetratricopeptide repeat-containing hybrid sensor histidine kinase/response regulator n=1 Tax=Aquimarina mycalae TaxID=3040073 RepID=UPI002477CDD4|nr:ATP-binding protein [Aquimarina sp. 2201CG14-23]MDH7445798.1 ATP-binding protein [Aquimarina sp. 2201CG14-23]
MRKILLFTYFIFSIPYLVYSQEKSKFPVNDSLQFLIDTSNNLTFEYKIKESLEYAVKAANYAHELNNDHYKAEAYYLIAYNYQTLVDYKNAEQYFRKSLENAEKTNDSLLILWNYNGLGNVYSDGYKDLNTSLDFYNKATALGKLLNNSQEYMTPVINLAWTYIDADEFDKAIPYLEEAEKLVIENRDIEGYCEVQYLKGKMALNNNEMAKAEGYFKDAIGIAEKHNMLLELSYTYEALAEMHQKQGNIEEAFKDLKLYHEYKDKVYDKDKLKQIEVAKVSFSVDEFKRELEITKTEKEYQANMARVNKTINIISVVGLILLLGVIFFIYIGYRSKKKLSDVLKEKNAQLIEAKSEAEKLTQVKSQFISTVSHELRTPLYGVVGITSLLLEDKDVLDKHRQLLGSLKFSGDYLLNLINNVLQISKIESNKVTLAKTPTNLFKLSQNLLNSFEYQAKSKDNKLILDVPNELPDSLNVDSLRLSEILINLIGNASKFTENGTIWLRIKILSRERNTIQIRYEVEDSGVGIPEDKKDYVFEKFSQVDRESNKLEGTGLGLSIVKNLLEMMDSQIQLESNEGRGTKFYFDLHLEILEEGEEQSSNERNNGATNVYRRILVAEDNKINQIVTKNLLSLIGYDCVIVENGFNAIQMMKKEDFDLILMDLNMPYLNGNEATRRIREFDKDTPIIALTAAELGEVKDECFEIGMNDIINKPLNKNDLRNIISKNLLP